MKTYTLTISPEYVSTWGTWEAIRELLQNAYDQRDLDSACVVNFSHDSSTQSATVETSTGRLSPRSLLLGNSSKSNDVTLRGQFGEGYKLALLVLVRSGHSVRITNGPEIWIPRLDFDEDFSCDVLKIDVHPIGGARSQGVRIDISNIRDEEWGAISKNVNENQTRDTILDQPEEASRIYVGGLFVTTVAGMKHGYAFSPASLKLDRDRGMVNNFDVSYATSKLWTHRQNTDPEAVYAMIEAEAPDVTYCENHASRTSPVTVSAYQTFVARHGDAIPVSTQAEVEKAQNAGVKWTLVPNSLRTLLLKVKSWIIPTTLSPSERLREFLSKNEWALSDEMKIELADIAEKFESKPTEPGPTFRENYRLPALELEEVTF